MVQEQFPALNKRTMNEVSMVTKNANDLLEKWKRNIGRIEMINMKIRKAVSKLSILLEFKVCNDEGERNLEETAAAALAQIEEKQYAAVLETRGVPADKIWGYGFAFEGKKVLIRGGAV